MAMRAAQMEATRKSLFRRTSEEQETTRELVNEELSATEKAFVKDTLNTLRAEVEELAKTAWLHETSDASIGCRIKL